MRDLLKPLHSLLELVQFSHAIFALPFALVSFLVASHPATSVAPGNLLWVFLKIMAAVLLARNTAMTFNRILDLPYDRQNPRTAKRPLVTGELSIPFAWFFLSLNALAFVTLAFSFNHLCGWLSLPTIFVLLFYSFTKRFTAWSHFFLGWALSLAPLGAWVAVRGTLAKPPLMLALAVFFWVSGFDMIYALQDESFDRKTHLHSAVVRLGRYRSLWLARLSHALVIPCLLAFYFLSKTLGIFFLMAVFIISGLLAYQHLLVKPHGFRQLDAEEIQKINFAFFRVNGLISVLLLWAVSLDLLVF